LTKIIKSAKVLCSLKINLFFPYFFQNSQGSAILPVFLVFFHFSAVFSLLKLPGALNYETPHRKFLTQKQNSNQKQSTEVDFLILS